MRCQIRIIVILAIMIFPILAFSEPIPPEMELWKPWVLHGSDEKLCPAAFNNGEAYFCSLPSRLTLAVETNGGTFGQQWLIFAKGWVALPGSAELWPMQVTVNGKETPVIAQSGMPSIFLTPGEYQVSGRFEWKDIPEMMKIPPSAGLVSLSINGKLIDSPVLDKQGQLWLQKRAQAGAQEDMQEIATYRLINDLIPMEIITHLQLKISGQAREIRLNNVLLNNSIPMKIESPLPIRMGRDNDFQIQARPGQWQIRIYARFDGPVREIAGFADEIWSFKSQNDLRMVEIEGALPIEPKQTDNPSDWKEFPAYIIKPDTQLKFKEIRRGDPDPAPDRLNLARTWWLDFDGKGFTVQDHITGTMSRGWYLAMNPSGILGRVSVDNTDQLITNFGETKKAGVELRRGQIELVADSRFEASSSLIPAVGWDHDVQSLSGRLNLPPGWRLLTAQGVDVVPGTWFQQWTLLDLFIMLIIALAVYKLKNKAWGLLALITLMLIYHEVDSPRTIWLHILAVLGLLKVLPDGWIRRLIRMWGISAVVILIMISIPFMVNQIRWGIYPQLEDFTPSLPSSIINCIGCSAKNINPPIQAVQMLGEAPKPSISNLPNQMAQDNLYRRQKAVFMQDPNAVVQTGPGLPQWQWMTVELKWNGPVDKSQQIRLWLLSPTINLILAFVRVFLLALLIFGILDLRYWWQTFHQKMGTAATAMILMLLIFNGISHADYPPQELLDELQERLLEKPDCLPNCAEIARMELSANSDNLQILLNVHAGSDTVIPLPGSLESWLPDDVYVGKIPAKGLAKNKDGVLQLWIPKGVHTVMMKGQLRNQHDIQIPLPLKPRRATLVSQGWDVQGIHPDGRVESAIRITRMKKSDGTQESTATTTLPPFLHIERVLHLGLTWEVSVTITRLTPPGTPVMISVPLIEGESVTTAGVHVDKNHVLVNMEPNTAEFSWTSALKMSDEIRLQAPSGVSWTESWILDASPIWHCELSGIAVIHHQDEEGHWRPTWMPWAGEQVGIRISRPQGVAGQLTTIDSALLNLTPGERFVKADLNLNLRTGKGAQHEILLPDQASLQFVKINDKSQPIRQEGRKVVVPLQPGTQKIDLEWHQSGGSSLVMKSPTVSIGEKAVNAKVTINMPRDRWILWASGPLMGPAVLFWSYLIVAIIVSVGLGQTRITPLRTYHWLLLNIGLTQVHPLVAMMIIGWLLALGVRKTNIPKDHWFVFNGTQLLLAFWTLAAMIGFYAAVEAGLLGIPNMQISGNGSYDYYLHWTQDRIGAMMPAVSVVSLPLLVYRCLMLVWALWLALSLLTWLKWGWTCFSEGKVWRKSIRQKTAAAEKI